MSQIMDPILKSHFLALYCMVLADGVIDALELETLYKIGTKDYGLTQEEIVEAVRDGGTSFNIPGTLEEKIKLLYDMAKIAWADGEIDDTEISLLKKYAVRFGFQAENAGKIAEYMLDCVNSGMTAEDITKLVTV